MGGWRLLGGLEAPGGPEAPGGLSGSSPSYPYQIFTGQRMRSLCCGRGRAGGGMDGEGGGGEGGGEPQGVWPIKRGTFPPPGSNFVPH